MTTHLQPQAAWCWASGVIEFGAETEVPEDSILIAYGPKAHLFNEVSIMARRGRGASEGLLLVPGVPEAANQRAGADALAKWLEWCAKGNGRASRHGVKFMTERAAHPV
ncbi:host nuclease inhibitor protein [Duganella sp. CY15W]|uniref:host nuclease inhibitor protein n=1 Tax=Duganella sp. CY15W TaxID=2692172 RepID=UPI00136F6971|nr:host nuclease inhibitor protein [Duganella sp. CY15W]MYM32238.1 host nuclease inhibitor protein [Duganella sp. CY15W]